MVQTHPRTSAARKLLWTLAGLIAVLVCAGVGLGLFIESRWALSYLQERATAAAGRTVTIDALRIDWGLTPRLILTDVVVDNPQWARHRHLARVERAAVSVSLPALVRGQWLFSDLLVEQPTLRLERAKEGAVSWTLDSGRRAADEAAGGFSQLPRIQSIRIADAQLSYRDASVDSALELTFSANLDDPGSPVELVANGSGHYGKEPVALKLRGGSAVSAVDQGAPFPVKLSAELGGQRLRISGEIHTFLPAPQMALEVSAKGPDLEAWRRLFTAEIPRAGEYALSVSVDYQDGIFSAEDLQFAMGDSDLRGSFDVKTGESPVSISAQLRSDRLDVTQLWPGPQDPSLPPMKLAATAIDVVAALDATINAQYGADTIISAGPMVEELDAKVLLDSPGRLDIATAASVAGMAVEASAQLAAEQQPARLRVHLEIGSAQEKLPATGGAQQAAAENNALQMPWLPEGKLAGEVGAELLLARAPGPAPERRVIERLSVGTFDLYYTHTAAATSLATALIDTADGFGLEVSGRLRGEPLHLRLKSTSLGELIEAGSAPLPWELTAQLGDSDIAGSATIAFAPARRIDIALTSRRLDLPGLLDPGDTDARVGRAADEEPANLKGLAALAAWTGELDWHIDTLAAPGATFADVAIDTELSDGQLQVDLLRLAAGGGHVEASLQLDLDAPGFSGALRGKGQDIDLGELAPVTASSTHGHPLQTGSGIAPGSVGGFLELRLPPASSKEGATTLPRIVDRLRLDDLRLRYDDPRLDARSNIRLLATDFRSPAHIEGNIEYRRRVVSVDLATGALNQVFTDWGSLPVDLDLQFEDTRVEVDATAGQLFPVKHLSAAVAVEGPTPAEVGSLLALPVPDLLPYRVEANLQRTQTAAGEDTWALSELEGSFGDSDINGKLRLVPDGERPTLIADLHSDRLDFDDLGPLVGVPPDPAETATESQEAAAEAFAERSLVLPTETLDLAQLTRADAHVEYRARRVQTPRLPLDDVAVELSLKNGHLLASPIDFGVAGGTAAFDLELKARSKPWTGKLAGQFDRVGLDRIFGRTDAVDDALGKIGGRVTLWVKGDSIADWLGGADGGSYLTIVDGTIDALLLELAGLDFIESLTLFLGNETSSDIECSYADLQVRDGTVTVRPLLIDTADTKIRGEGTIDLKRERLDLTLRPYPQDVSLLTSRGPLHVDGTFKDPAFTVDASFPGPDFGTATDSVRCDGLVEAVRDARKKNARL